MTLRDAFAILANISELPVQGIAIIALLVVTMASMWVAWSLVQKMISMTPVLENIAMAIKDTNSIHAEQVKFLQDRMEQRLDRHEDLLENISKDTALTAERTRICTAS